MKTIHNVTPIANTLEDDTSQPLFISYNADILWLLEDGGHARGICPAQPWEVKELEKDTESILTNKNTMKFNTNERTEHGSNIANEIQDEDAYGASGRLSAADVWNIVDNLHTHFLDVGDNQLNALMGIWMKELDSKFPEIERL